MNDLAQRKTADRARLHAYILANALSNLAEPCIRFGVSWYVLHATDSIALFTALFTFSVAIDALSRPLLAPLADYFDRLRITRICSAVAMGASALLALTVLWVPFSLPLLAALMLALSMVSALRDPAADALVAQIVEPADMLRVERVRTFAGSTVITAGPVLAGITVAALSPAAALGAAALLEGVGLAGALLLRRKVRTDAAADPAADPSWKAYRTVWHHRVIEGLRCLWHTRSERDVILASSFINAAVVGFLSLVLPVWVSRTLEGSATLMAWLEASYGAGLLLGSGVLIGVLNRHLGAGRATVVGPLIAAAAFVGAAVTTSVPVLAVLIALAAAGVSLYIMNTAMVRALATPDHFRSRMLGSAGFVVYSMLPPALAVFGWLLDLSPQVALLVCAALFTLGAVLLGRNKVLHELLHLPREEIAGRYGTLYPHAFRERPAD